MKFFKFWAKATETFSEGGQQWQVERYGASNDSLRTAQADAEQKARDTAEVFRRGEFPDSYLYADRPVREEIVEAFGDDDNPLAVITRNAYGSLVLNTARVLFADIDDPEESEPDNPIKPLMKMLGGFFGAEEIVDDILDEPADGVPQRMAELVEATPGLGLRLYRTAAGYRCLVTSHEFDPLAAETQQLLESMESDPLYIQLCQVQECFRARLTPKFWRCGGTAPPARFPWADASQEQSMRAWERVYSSTCESFATCELVEHLGNQDVLSQVEPIVQLHDNLSCQAGLPLA